MAHFLFLFLVACCDFVNIKVADQKCGSERNWLPIPPLTFVLFIIFHFLKQPITCNTELQPK